ncbi:MAG: phosphotransferase [Promethearchaeota archaeon]
MIIEIKKFLYQNEYFADALGARKIDDIQVLVITSEWKKENGKSIFAIFSKWEKTPRYILSVMHDQRYNYYLEREFENLRKVRSIPDNLISSKIPEPLFLGELKQQLVLIQSAMVGESLRAIIPNKFRQRRFQRKIGLFDELVNWILRFEEKFPSNRDMVSTKSIILDEINFFRETQQFDSVIEKYLDEIKTKLEKMENQLPAARPQHCDFWVGNVFVKENSISGIIDWEMFKEITIPFNDIFSLATHCGFWCSPLQSENYLMHEFLMQFKSEWYATQVAIWFKRYLKKNNLELEVLDLLIPMILIKRTNDMQKIIGENTIDIENTWRELFNYFVIHKAEYLPRVILKHKKSTS